MASETTSTHRFEKLRVGNYAQWRGDCSAALMVKGWLRITQGKEMKPTPKDPKAPTEAEQEKMDAWEEKALRAAGEIYLSLSDDQKTHVQHCLEDPVTMWATLQSVHL